MKALDKVFDTQVITGIIGDKAHFIEAKKNLCLYEEGRKRTRKTVSKLQSLQKKINQEFIKVQSEWNIERCGQVTNYMIQLILKI